MTNFLSRDQLFFINQSEATRKILKAEKANEAREREFERLAQAEEQWAASQKVKPGKLVNEWRTVGEGRLTRHVRTGMLLLNGERLADGDLISIRHAGEPILVIVRYTYTGATREIVGAYGDSEGRGPVTLAQGMKAEWAIDELEPEPEPEGWHIKFRATDGKYHVIKDTLEAGVYDDVADAGDLATMLNSYERTKALDTAHNADNIQYRRA